MTADDTARDQAWAEYEELSRRFEPDEKIAFITGWNARARHVPEPVGDRVDAALSAFYRVGSTNDRLYNRMSRALAAADALAPPPVVPDEVQERAEDCERLQELADAEAAAKAQDIYICATEEASGLREEVAKLKAQIAGAMVRAVKPDDPDYVGDGTSAGFEIEWPDEDAVRSLLAAPAQPAPEFEPCDDCPELPGCTTDAECRHMGLGAAPAQPAEDAERNDYASTHLVLDRYGVPRDVNGGQLLLEERVATLPRRIRDLEERLQGLLTASTRYWAGDDEDGAEMLAEFKRARAILQGGSDADRR
jgi:hypothetical protein